MGKAAIIGCLLFATWTSPATNPALKNTAEAAATLDEMIQWMSWEEALAMQKVEKRKIIVDIFTDWCVWCKRMENTFQQETIANYINENYYAIKFNAEQKDDIAFQGKTYRFINSGKTGYHELAAEITQGRLGYPSIVFLDESLAVIQSINGYKEAEEFEMIITYFAEDYHRKMPWEKYTRLYKTMKD